MPSPFYYNSLYYNHNFSVLLSLFPLLCAKSEAYISENSQLQRKSCLRAKLRPFQVTRHTLENPCIDSLFCLIHKLNFFLNFSNLIFICLVGGSNSQLAVGGIIDPSLNFFVGEVLFREFQPLPITNLERSSATLTFGCAKVRGGKKKNI